MRLGTVMRAHCFCCLAARRPIGQFSPAMAMRALDCAALKAEFDFAAELGENAPARRRHIRALQRRKAMCDAAQNLNFNWRVKIF